VAGEAFLRHQVACGAGHRDEGRPVRHLEERQAVSEAGRDQRLRSPLAHDLRAEAEAGDAAFAEPRDIVAVESVARRIRRELGSRGEQDLAGGEEGRRVAQVGAVHPFDALVEGAGRQVALRREQPQ
jgi:hypothetical protein